jgi:hypothetical protein
MMIDDPGPEPKRIGKSRIQKIGHSYKYGPANLFRPQAAYSFLTSGPESALPGRATPLPRISFHFDLQLSRRVSPACVFGLHCDSGAVFLANVKPALERRLESQWIDPLV